MWRNTQSGWGVISIALHWLSALTIVGLFVLGWWMTDLGYYDTWYNQAPWVYRSIGYLVVNCYLCSLNMALDSANASCRGKSL